jgi:hypothetical protein
MSSKKKQKKIITDPYATQNFNIGGKNENCLKYKMLNHSLSTDTIEEENSNGFGTKLKVKTLATKRDSYIFLNIWRLMSQPGPMNLYLFYQILN